jgi:hypothetical protein
VGEGGKKSPCAAQGIPSVSNVNTRASGEA